MRSVLFVIVTICLGVLDAGAVEIDGEKLLPVTTYSIVARDAQTGELGVAVQSHWFSVGSVVPWLEAGIGAVATQSLTDVSYGPLGLEMMRSGKTAAQALRGLLEADENPQWRQVGMIDASGNRAVHTGVKCIREAGHVSGEDFIVMANLMDKNTVWEAMASAFKTTRGDLAERMLAALEAAQREGGDIRGKQSAALVVVTGNPTGVAYKDRLFDLRIEDHPDPVRELRRLVKISRAYRHMNDGDEMLTRQDMEGAMEAYNTAMELAPDIIEIQFWAALTLFTNGEEEEALKHFRNVFTKDPKWMEVVRRLPKADLLENENGEVGRILGAIEKRAVE